jgi:hypothetical protein
MTLWGFELDVARDRKYLHFGALNVSLFGLRVTRSIVPDLLSPLTEGEVDGQSSLVESQGPDLETVCMFHSVNVHQICLHRLVVYVLWSS